MRKFFLTAMCFAAAFLCSCSHNTDMFTLGDSFNIGIDPQNFGANIHLTSGLNVMEISRQNASWSVKIDQKTGIIYDKQTGSIRGVKQLSRTIGPQVTGYLVDFAKQNPQLAVKYFDALKAYWEYQKTKACKQTEEKAQQTGIKKEAQE